MFQVKTSDNCTYTLKSEKELEAIKKHCTENGLGLTNISTGEEIITQESKKVKK